MISEKTLFSKTLRRMPQFHLISWFGNFVESHSFREILWKGTGSVYNYTETVPFHKISTPGN